MAKTSNTYYLIGKLQCWVVYLVISCILPSCIQQTEGCMDVLATNFNASTDLSCENKDCCRYPNLNLSITHAIGDTTLNYTDTITYDNKAFRILSVSFYAHNFALTSMDSEAIINDQITLTDRSDNLHTLRDDITLISRNTINSSYALGEFPVSGSYQNFQFDLGLSTTIAATKPSSVPSTHVLSSELGLFELPDSNYIFTQLEILNTNNNDTLKFDIYQLTPIRLPYNIVINRGVNTTIPLKIDYLKWLTGINFDDDYPLIKQAITNNLSNAFSISE